MIKTTIIQKISNIIKKSVFLKFGFEVEKFVVEKINEISFGDFYSNIGLILLSKISDNKEKALEDFKFELLKNPLFSKIEIVKGYFNFFIADEYKVSLLKEIIKQKANFGQFLKKDDFYNIEIVSANPTGSLHIGHARNGALGQTLANIWKKYGIKVEVEYYINDGGNQIDNLGLSVFYRYLQLCGKEVEMLEDFYQGEEPKEVAKIIYTTEKDKFATIPVDEFKKNEAFAYFKDFSKNYLMEEIKKDLLRLKINIEIYFPESDIYKMNLIQQTLDKLGEYVYQHDGATWIKTTAFGDDKDRVVIKSDGSSTYLMPDIAYHNIKITRHEDITKIFDIWGADHKSYADRMKIAMQCLGHKKDILEIILMQMVKLTKDGKDFKMSKRTGTSLTVKDLLNSVGLDNARWSLVSQSADSHIEMDVDKYTTSEAGTDKVIYEKSLFTVLYAYARINKILQKTNYVPNLEDVKTDLLTLPKERNLITMLFYYPHTIESIATNYAVNKLPTYLTALASIFNSYYGEVHFVNETNTTLLQQRLNLLYGILNTIKSGLNLLDIEPKENI